MAFPNFFGKQYESASNFLDDLEMAFLVSRRDEEEVKLRAFPLVLKDSAKNWFQNLEPGRKTNWETLKETFLLKYGGLDNPEHLWHRISSLHQATSRTYLTYESQFLRLWAEWEASLAEGERAPNFLKKVKFLAGLFPDLHEKVKGKFPETFEEALQIARVKDRKLEYQAHTSRVEHPQGPTMADERLPPAPTTTPEDPHLELLQRVTNQLDNLSINMVQGVRQQQPQPNNERMPNGPRRQPQRRDYFCYNCGEEGHGMYFCPHPRNFNAQAGRGRQQVTPPRARPPPQIQPQILQNPQMVAQPQVLQRSVSPQPVAEIPPLPNNNAQHWDKHLNAALWAYRTSFKASLGFTPFQLVYGQEALLPIEVELFSLRLLQTRESNPKEKMKERILALERLELDREAAILHYINQADRRRLKFNKKLSPKIIKKSSLVLRYDNRFDYKWDDKFMPHWEGPYKVSEVFSNGSYKLMDATGKLLRTPVNGWRLKPYFSQVFYEKEELEQEA
ncbi:hypothetical protein L7F22_000889 [Adiantum nelumboides]|nr:hypothetical protein [Adiantum nelumboides]